MSGYERLLTDLWATVHSLEKDIANAKTGVEAAETDLDNALAELRDLEARLEEYKDAIQALDR